MDKNLHQLLEQLQICHEEISKMDLSFVRRQKKDSKIE